MEVVDLELGALVDQFGFELKLVALLERLDEEPVLGVEGGGDGEDQVGVGGGLGGGHLDEDIEGVV